MLQYPFISVASIFWRVSVNDFGSNILRQRSSTYVATYSYKLPLSLTHSLTHSLSPPSLQHGPRILTLCMTSVVFLSCWKKQDLAFCEDLLSFN
jgi:hypothetical protein